MYVCVCVCVCVCVYTSIHPYTDIGGGGGVALKVAVRYDWPSAMFLKESSPAPYTCILRGMFILCPRVFMFLTVFFVICSTSCHMLPDHSPTPPEPLRCVVE